MKRRMLAFVATGALILAAQPAATAAAADECGLTANRPTSSDGTTVRAFSRAACMFDGAGINKYSRVASRVERGATKYSYGYSPISSGTWLLSTYSAAVNCNGWGTNVSVRNYSWVRLTDESYQYASTSGTITC